MVEQLFPVRQHSHNFKSSCAWLTMNKESDISAHYKYGHACKTELKELLPLHSTSSLHLELLTLEWIGKIIPTVNLIGYLYNFLTYKPANSSKTFDKGSQLE